MDEFDCIVCGCTACDYPEDICEACSDKIDKDLDIPDDDEVDSVEENWDEEDYSEDYKEDEEE
jgi:hypothetical protein